MESRASHALVGLCTLVVLATVFGFVFWFSSGRGEAKVNVRIVFNDKVTGLGTGSSVLFNGLRVGEVTQIGLQPDDPRQIFAMIEVDRSTPLRVDTRATIEAQGLAGVSAVQLLGGEPNSPILTAQPGQATATIMADRSEDILEMVRSMAKRTDDALSGVEVMIKENAGTIADRIKDAEQFSAVLSDNSGSVENFMKSIGTVAEFVAPLTSKLGGFSQDLTDTIRSFDPNRVVSVVDEVAKFSDALGSGDVDKAVKDTVLIAQKLNRAADQVEGVLKGAQVFMNTAAGQDGRSAFKEVSDVARSIRELADSLDERMAEITAEITRFTRSGTTRLESLTTTGRRALTGFGRNLQDVERNPQGLLFGKKPQIPQYNGAR